MLYLTSKIKNSILGKADILFVYLGTDITKCKMGVRFVISTTKTSKDTFIKKTFSKKIRTYMTEVPEIYISKYKFLN